MLLLALGALGVIFSFFIRNNPELMGRQVSVRADSDSLTKTDARNSADDTANAAERSASARLTAQAPASRFSTGRGTVIEVPSVVASPLDRPDLDVSFSAGLVVTGDELVREALFKRDEIRVMIQDIIATMPMSEITVLNLEVGVKDRVSALLQHGSVQNVMFKDFRITAGTKQ